MYISIFTCIYICVYKSIHVCIQINEHELIYILIYIYKCTYMDKSFDRSCLRELVVRNFGGEKLPSALRLTASLVKREPSPDREPGQA